MLGDREFHSPKLAEWLDSRGLAFVLRQKKDLHFRATNETEYKVVNKLDRRPGMSQFYSAVTCNKGDGLGPFNLAIYSPLIGNVPIVATALKLPGIS